MESEMKLKKELSIEYERFYADILRYRTVILKRLKTKRRPLYLKTQFVPRSKHFSSRL